MTKQEKATKTGFRYYNSGYSTIVEYEYRGHKYDVEYSNCSSYCCTPAYIQHRDAQEKVDRKIEMEEQAKQKPHRYEDTAEYGFDLLWQYWEES